MSTMHTEAAPIIARTAYEGPRDLPSGRTRGSHIRVSWTDPATGKPRTRAVSLDLAAKDPHEAAVQSIWPEPRSYVAKDWRNPYANDSGTRRAFKVRTLPDAIGVTITVQNDGMLSPWPAWLTDAEINRDPHGTRWEHRRWDVVFTFEGRRHSLVYSTGSLIESITGPEVLSSLFGDAASGTEDFDDFARDMGYDTEDRDAMRSAKRTWNACVTLNRQLRALLGDSFDEFETIAQEWEI